MLKSGEETGRPEKLKNEHAKDHVRTVAKKSGRKNKSDEWRAPEALEVIRSWRRGGMTQEEIADCMGISRSTLNDWAKKFPDISDALKITCAYAHARVENSLFCSAVGHVVPLNKQKVLKDGTVIDYVEETYIKPDVAAIIFYLTNRRPDVWKNNRKDSAEQQEESGVIQLIVNHEGLEELEKKRIEEAMERDRLAEKQNE